MIISFQGFQWECPNPKLNLPLFLNSYQQVNGQEQKNRLTYFIKNDKYWNGLVLTVKNMRRFVTLKESGQDVILDAYALSPDERLADFNFFVFDDKTSFGLYQHYHRSCSLNTFNRIAERYYNTFRDKLLTEITNECKIKRLKKKEIEQMTKGYKGSLETSILEREGDFITRISNMLDPYSTEIVFTDLDFCQNDFTPIKPYLKKAKYKFSFEKNNGVLQKKQWLIDFFKKSYLKNATVSGLDENGDDVIYKLFNDFYKFRTYDYEDMVPSLNLDVNKIKESILNNNIIHELNSAFSEISSSLS